MDETPYIQTISDEVLDRMILRRKNRALEYLKAGDDGAVKNVAYHYFRAIAERNRRRDG